MKHMWTVFLLVGVIRAADVRVYQSGYEIVDNTVRHAAMSQATRMYGAIGVRLHWEGKKPDGVVAVAAVVVRYTMRTPGHPGAMAYARPFDPDHSITVMYDRILDATERNRQGRAALLGHVLAHEIGHALMRTKAHSPNGIMKAHWGVEDYSRMLYRPLSFMPEDALVIRRELARYSPPASLSATADGESDGVNEK